MKRCPKCGSITCGDTECRVCGETLTYAETEMCDRESIPPGRYGVRYFTGRFFLPVLSVLFAVGAATLSGWNKKTLTGYVVLIVLSLAVVAAQALIERFYPEVLEFCMRRHKREYSEAMLRIDIAVASVLIIVVSVIILFITH